MIFILLGCSPVFSQIQWEIQEPFKNNAVISGRFPYDGVGNDLVFLGSIREEINGQIQHFYKLYNGKKLINLPVDKLKKAILGYYPEESIKSIFISYSFSMGTDLFYSGAFSATNTNSAFTVFYLKSDTNGNVVPLILDRQFEELGYTAPSFPSFAMQFKGMCYLPVFKEVEMDGDTVKVYDMLKISNQEIEIIKLKIRHEGHRRLMCFSGSPIKLHNYNNQLVLTAAPGSIDSNGNEIPYVSIFEENEALVPLGENQIPNGGCVSLVRNGELWIGGYEPVEGLDEFIEGQNVARLADNLWTPVGTTMEENPYRALFQNEVFWMDQVKGQLFIYSNLRDLFVFGEDSWENISPDSTNAEKWKENYNKGRPEIFKDKIVIPAVEPINFSDGYLNLYGYTISSNPNTSPIAINDTLVEVKNRIPKFINPRLNDINSDPDYLFVNLLDSSKNGTINQLNTESFFYISHSDFEGLDSIQYEVCDVDGLCDTAMIFFNVEFYNTPPVGINDTLQVLNSQKESQIKPLNNDFDNEGDSLIFNLVTWPEFGEVIEKEGKLFYSHEGNGAFSKDSFTYQVCDPFGGCSPEVKALVKLDSVLTSLSQNLDLFDLKVFPNPLPSGSVLTIKSSQKLDELYFYDVVGKEVNVEIIGVNDTTNLFRFENYPSGLYMIKALFNNQVVLKKIIVD